MSSFDINYGIYTITYLISGSTVSITNYADIYNTYASLDLSLNSIIPYNYMNYTLVSIGNNAFNSAYTLRSIKIPNTVTNIIQLAFYYCTYLSSIIIPNSVTSIGVSAFFGCGFGSITIPNSIQILNTNIFEWCGSLTSIIIPNSVTYIDTGAFYSCNSLLSVTFLGDIPFIASYNFQLSGDTVYYYIYATNQQNFQGLFTTYVPIPFTYIYQNVIYNFLNSSNVSVIGFETPPSDYFNLTIPSTITYLSNPYNVVNISDNAFNSSKIASVILPNSITSIGQSACNGCFLLTNIQFSNNVINIGESAFYGCTSLTNIIIPNMITIINTSVFQNCSSLTSIIIPNSVTYIDTGAFQDCNSLSSVTFTGNIPTISSGNFGLQGDTAYYYAYATNLQNFQGLFTNYIMLPFTYTVAYVVYNFLNNNNVSIIGYEFTGYWNLTLSSTITYNSTIYNVVDISSNAFQNSTSLGGINIPNSITSIGDNAFFGCTNLVNVNIPNSITNIGASAFQSCSYLLSCNLPSSITILNENIFTNCTSLTSVILPNSLTSIEQNAFYSCTSLTSINLPINITSIGQNAFYNCTSLTSINLPNSISSISSGLLQGCSSLTSVIIPASISSINSQAFYGCSKLITITIPSLTTLIDINAFYNCSSLSSVTFLGNIPAINTGNFTITGDTVYYYIYATNQQNFQGLFTTYVPIPFTYIYQNVIYNFLNSSNVSVIGVSDPPFNWNLNIPSAITYLSNPYYVTNINSSAFSNCINLISVIIPSTVTYIDISVFQGCTSLTSINIPTSVTTLSNALFEGCIVLPSITIPISVTYIQTNAFLSCNSLKSVTFLGNIPTISSGNFTITGDTAYYNNGALNTNILPQFFSYVQCINCPPPPPPEKQCVWKCDKNKWDKFKFTSNGNNPNISYKQQLSIKINNTVGGNVHYGQYYLGKPIQVNYLGRTEGQPGGSGAPLRNKF